MHGDTHGENAAMDVDTDNDSEELELWLHDPVACIRELIGNPAFNGDISYVLQKVYADHQGRTQQYDEMWTGNW